MMSLGTSHSDDIGSCWSDTNGRMGGLKMDVGMVGELNLEVDGELNLEVGELILKDWSSASINCKTRIMYIYMYIHVINQCTMFILITRDGDSIYAILLINAKVPWVRQCFHKKYPS